MNFAFAVSDTFTIASGGANLNGMSFSAWIFPGDELMGAEVAITSSEFGGTTYYDQFISFTQSGCVVNQYGFNVCTESASFGPGVNLAAGTYWLTLENGELPDDPVYWDENSGPSSASANSIGTIPSESFTLNGSSTSGSTPEPGSLRLFGTGILALAGLLRHRLF